MRAAVKKKRRSRSDPEDEPLAEGEDWIDCGGQRIWAAGFTEGGFPYGVTEEDFRKESAVASPHAGWARAKRILEATLRQQETTAEIEIGYVRKIGQGLSRDVFAAEVEIAAPSRRDVLQMAVLLPRRGCDPDIDERTRKETRLLGELATMDLPFRVPRVFGLHVDGSHLALVRSFERGLELELRAGRQGRVQPWETVATVAASIHGIEGGRLPWLEPRYATRHDHARAALRELDAMSEPEVIDARAWAEDHLPPATPSTLVHGDLLGQNILLDLEDSRAVIDWEYSQVGDPAYDLAIVTRGVRRPFQMDTGMDRLLDAYARAGGTEVTRAHVHVHELALAARWYKDSLSGKGPHPPPQQLAFLRSLLRRASAQPR